MSSNEEASAPSGASEAPTPTGRASRAVGWLARRSGWVIGAVVLASAALVYPLVWMPPTATASQDPGGPVFDTQRLAGDRFASRAHRMIFIVEAREGDLFGLPALAELLENARAVRADPRIGPKLLHFPFPATGKRVHGLMTLADAVDEQLRAGGGAGLPKASQARVDEIVRAILGLMPADKLGLSVRTARDAATGRYSSPAMMLLVLADNEALGGGGESSGLGTRSTEKEQFARRVLERLRGDERHIRVWGLAIDVNLTSMEQGQAAGPFIGVTILAALLLVGLLLRSYWAVAVVGLALGAVMLWLKGVANLVGFKQDLILATIVPIAMISFGVDFAFHSVGRYREAVAGGLRSTAAFRVAMASALGALGLAMATSVAAFLSNLSSGIESLAQFGIAAAVGTASAFLLLGVFTPLVLMRIEARRGPPEPGRGLAALLFEVGAGVLAGLGAMAAVVVMVFVKPWLGAALLGAYAILALLLPAWLLPRRSMPATEGGSAPAAPGGRGQIPWLGLAVSRLARHRVIVVPSALALTVVAVVLALRVDTAFDVKDFFSPRSDFVVGLDKFETHLGSRSGEPALVYVEGPLARPESIRALRDFARDLRGTKTPRLARDERGALLLEPGLLAVLDAVVRFPAQRKSIEKHLGRALVDADGDGIFDRPEDLLAVFRYARQNGLPDASARPTLTRDYVRTLLWIAEDGERLATAFRVRIPGSRANENLAAARDAVAPLVDALRHRLTRLDRSSRAVLTGQPIARYAALDAIREAFRYSFAISVVICVLLASLFMRSIRYGLVSSVPIVIVVAWLYAFMYVAGFSINVVTATIGAISIGVGIDFAVHFTMRYREELARGLCRGAALYEAGAGTGGALLGAGLSSILGFTVLAFAPMPMFAAYGLLTAVMIGLASVASLLVLPSLLALVTPTRP